MYFIKLFVVLAIAAFVIKETVLALDDLVYAIRSRKVKSLSHRRMGSTSGDKDIPSGVR